MIITLKGANFSGEGKNIGTLDTYSIIFKGVGVTNSNTSVDRESNTGYTTTITLAENYELNGSITVTMGGTDITSTVTIDGLTITIPTKVTGKVEITVPTKSTNTEPEQPVTPTTYTITYVYVDASGATIKADTTETVAAGTVKSFTTSDAPTIDDYTVNSVSPTSATVDSDIIVTYYYTANEAEGDGKAYWVGEKLSGKVHGTGTASSYLGTQYYYITDEAAISELSGKTVDKMAFNFAVKSGGANTTAGAITVYLVNLSDSVPTNWEAKAEIPVESYPSGSQKEFDITPFVVPAGYTVGYSASKQSILGGGYMMQDYKIGGAYYEDVDTNSSKNAGLGGVDIHIQGM